MNTTTWAIAIELERHRDQLATIVATWIAHFFVDALHLPTTAINVTDQMITDTLHSSTVVGQTSDPTRHMIEAVIVSILQHDPVERERFYRHVRARVRAHAKVFRASHDPEPTVHDLPLPPTEDTIVYMVQRQWYGPATTSQRQSTHTDTILYTHDRHEAMEVAKAAVAQYEAVGSVTRKTGRQSWQVNVESGSTYIRVMERLDTRPLNPAPPDVTPLAKAIKNGFR